MPMPIRVGIRIPLSRKNRVNRSNWSGTASQRCTTLGVSLIAATDHSKRPVEIKHMRR